MPDDYNWYLRLLYNSTFQSMLKEMVKNTQFSEIRIPCANTVKIVMPDGTETVRTWQNRSRSESWTPEMKQKARERKLSNG